MSSYLCSSTLESQIGQKVAAIKPRSKVHGKKRISGSVSKIQKAGALSGKVVIKDTDKATGGSLLTTVRG